MPFKFFLLLIALFFSVNGEESSYIILRSRDSGMFSIFDDVAGLLKKFDKGKIGGIEIDFEHEGAYYEPLYGPNWWSYYCKPLKVGDPSGCLVINSLDFWTHKLPYSIEFGSSRQEVHRIIETYFHIKPEIIKNVEDFCENEFEGFVFGIHYRGTDKIHEAPRTKYRKIKKQLKSEVLTRGLQNYKIFIAADEQAFLDYMINKYGSKVIYVKEAERSLDGNPLHLGRSEGKYQQGLDALTDCLLLSKTDYLIRTSSNLSRWSTYFNPDLPVILMSDRY